MSVKRYDVMSYSLDVDGNSGPFVKYDDYAALERKLAESQREFRAADATIENLQMQLEKMAAENAGLKDAISSIFPDGVEDEPGMIGFTATAKKAFYTLNETPATDAFLAEVRARAVDEVCLKISNSIPNCYQDELVGLDMAATICGDFASELRKGVQS